MQYKSFDIIFGLNLVRFISEVYTDPKGDSAEFWIQFGKWCTKSIESFFSSSKELAVLFFYSVENVLQESFAEIFVQSGI